MCICVKRFQTVTNELDNQHESYRYAEQQLQRYCLSSSTKGGTIERQR